MIVSETVPEANDHRMVLYNCDLGIDPAFPFDTRDCGGVCCSVPLHLVGAVLSSMMMFSGAGGLERPGLSAVPVKDEKIDRKRQEIMLI